MATAVALPATRGWGHCRCRCRDAWAAPSVAVPAHRSAEEGVEDLLGHAKSLPFLGGEVMVVTVAVDRCRGRGAGGEEARDEKTGENDGKTTEHEHFPTVSADSVRCHPPGAEGP